VACVLAAWVLAEVAGASLASSNEACPSPNHYLRPYPKLWQKLQSSSLPLFYIFCRLSVKRR
jgi:hypothetical protein